MMRFVLLGAVTLMVSTAASSREPVPAPTGDIVRGRASWMADGCSACHGRSGQGGYGPVIAGTVLDLDSFSYLVRSPPRIMPAYTAKTVSDEELADIYAFAKSLPGPRPVTGSSMLTPHP